jgi:hypothetical protein
MVANLGVNVGMMVEDAGDGSECDAGGFGNIGDRRSRRGGRHGVGVRTGKIAVVLFQ